MDSSSRQRASTQRVICEEVFGEKQHSSDGISAVLSGPSTVRLFLFPKIKSVLKGTRFESVDAVEAKATKLLNSLTQDDLQHCFQQWKIRIGRFRDRGGDYIEGDNISIIWFFFQYRVTAWIRFLYCHTLCWTVQRLREFDVLVVVNIELTAFCDVMLLVWKIGTVIMEEPVLPASSVSKCEPREVE